MTLFAQGQHASSKPVGLELNSSSFSGRRVCLSVNERRGKGEGRTQDTWSFPPFPPHRGMHLLSVDSGRGAGSVSLLSQD